MTGVPFVYLWGDKPIMRYGTTAVLGATNWKAPLWIGRPVQWCGLVYADALLDLAAHDDTLDWRKLARGITIAGEQMQYPEGNHVGTLPDSIGLNTQQRYPADINPVALVNLRRRLADKPVGLQVAVGGGHHVVAPFPVHIESGQAVIDAEPGQQYQVVIDGDRIEMIDSTGTDRLALD
jgi:hypothetical protein